MCSFVHLQLNYNKTILVKLSNFTSIVFGGVQLKHSWRRMVWHTEDWCLVRWDTGDAHCQIVTHYNSSIMADESLLPCMQFRTPLPPPPLFLLHGAAINFMTFVCLKSHEFHHKCSCDQCLNCLQYNLIYSSTALFTWATVDLGEGMEWYNLSKVLLDVHELDVGERDMCVLVLVYVFSVCGVIMVVLQTPGSGLNYLQTPSEEEQAFPATSASSPHRSKDPLYGCYAHSCCWYNGKLYLYGGHNDIQFCEGIDCYDIGESTAKFRIKCTIQCSY